jgi:hypothetical protein
MPRGASSTDRALTILTSLSRKTQDSQSIEFRFETGPAAVLADDDHADVHQIRWQVTLRDYFCYQSFG